MRRFMDQFAETKGFKSLHSHEWYTVSILSFVAAGVMIFCCHEVIVVQGTSILSHFGNSVARALMNVYPQVGFDVNKFSRVPGN